jgi:hypothetical protein
MNENKKKKNQAKSKWDIKINVQRIAFAFGSQVHSYIISCMPLCRFMQAFVD